MLAENEVSLSLALDGSALLTRLAHLLEDAIYATSFVVVQQHSLFLPLFNPLLKCLQFFLRLDLEQQVLLHVALHGVHVFGRRRH